MQEANIYTNKIDGTKRQVSWIELNQLKKDILWIFDENGNELHSAFVPEYSFTLPYWEYISLSGDEWLPENDKNFYISGTLIIILCMIVEYIDIPGGSQSVFGDTKMSDILACVKIFDPSNRNQGDLKEVLQLGLSISATITKADIDKNEEYDHPDLKTFFSKLPWVKSTFISTYYRSKLN